MPPSNRRPQHDPQVVGVVRLVRVVEVVEVVDVVTGPAGVIHR